MREFVVPEHFVGLIRRLSDEAPGVIRVDKKLHSDMYVLQAYINSAKRR